MPNDLEEPGAVRAGMARARAAYAAIFALVLIALAALCASAASAAGPTVVMHDLGGFSWTSVDIGGVSDAGQVVGHGEVRYENNHGFAATVAGGFTDVGFLGPQGGSASASLNAINARGLAVGYSTGDLDPEAGALWTHAVTWTAAGGLVDIGTLGGSFSYATA